MSDDREREMRDEKCQEIGAGWLGGAVSEEDEDECEDEEENEEGDEEGDEEEYEYEAWRACRSRCQALRWSLR